MIKELKEVRSSLEDIVNTYKYHAHETEQARIAREAIAKLDGVIERLESPELIARTAKAIIDSCEYSISPEKRQAALRAEQPYWHDAAKAAINVILDKGEVL